MQWLCPISRFAKLLRNFKQRKQVHWKLRGLSGVIQGQSESCVGGTEDQSEKKKAAETKPKLELWNARRCHDYKPCIYIQCALYLTADPWLESFPRQEAATQMVLFVFDISLNLDKTDADISTVLATLCQKSNFLTFFSQSSQCGSRTNLKSDKSQMDGTIQVFITLPEPGSSMLTHKQAYKRILGDISVYGRYSIAITSKSIGSRRFSNRAAQLKPPVNKYEAETTYATKTSAQ